MSVKPKQQLLKLQQAIVAKSEILYLIIQLEYVDEHHYLNQSRIFIVHSIYIKYLPIGHCDEYGSSSLSSKIKTIIAVKK